MGGQQTEKSWEKYAEGEAPAATAPASPTAPLIEVTSVTPNSSDSTITGTAVVTPADLMAPVAVRRVARWVDSDNNPVSDELQSSLEKAFQQSVIETTN